MRLDRFQREAIEALKSGCHVLVSAPTSSGKTLIAEHLLKQDVSSVLYTTPTKALCNQKFMEFNEKGYDVGLKTGDRDLNEDALHLVMTTEILLKMLVQFDDRIAESAFYVFDEFHYIGDKSRGHVWEECMLKVQRVQVLCLSATISNAKQIQSWITHCTGKDVALIVESKRPVPLELKIMQKDGTLSWKRSYERPKGNRRSDWIHVCQSLNENLLMPAIAFVFNRQECHEHAEAAASIDWLTSAQSSCVLRELQNVQVHENLRRQMLRGVGVHHSGLIPEVREATERLTAKGVLRIVFATETLAIGLNMPTRTIVFASLNKHDEEQRLLTTTEYTQLIGRAGRRGHDPVGTVIFPWWIPGTDIDQLVNVELPPVVSQLQVTTHLVLHHEREILGQTFRLFPQTVQRRIDSKAKLADPDLLMLHRLSLHLPFYKKLPKKILNKAKFALTPNGYKELEQNQQILSLADINHKPLPLKKYTLPHKTIWYLEHETQIKHLTASRPGSPPRDIAEMSRIARRLENYLALEEKQWDEQVDWLDQMGYTLGSLKLQAAKYFYAVNPIDAVEYLTHGMMSQNPKDIVEFLSSLLNCRCQEALPACLEQGTKEVAEEYLVFEGDLIASKLRLRNLLREFQHAANVIMPDFEVPKIFEF